MSTFSSKEIERIIASRMKRRGTTADMQRLRYVNDCLYRPLVGRQVPSTLYVGIGHGLDAALAILDGLTESVVGVDPYIDSDGNDDSDYKSLMMVLHNYGLTHRFHVERQSIQHYASKQDARFDLIICNDVLHHIFWTPQLLSKCDAFSEAVDLFSKLGHACHRNGVLVIGEPERNGLRQILTKYGFLKSSVNYATKQPRGEWIKAAVKGGWLLSQQANYIPYKFRRLSGVWSGNLGRYTLCDKYFLYMTRNGAV